MKVRHIDVRVLKSDKYENEYEVKELDVVAENELYLVLGDLHFTTLRKVSKEGSGLNPVLNKHTVSIRDHGIECLDGIHYTEYTTRNVQPETIKRRIRKFIEEKYGYMFKPDLSFIN